MTTTTSAPPGALKTWLMAVRVPTLPAAVVPVLVGSALSAAASPAALLASLVGVPRRGR